MVVEDQKGLVKLPKMQDILSELQSLRPTKKSRSSSIVPNISGTSLPMLSSVAQGIGSSFGQPSETQNAIMQVYDIDPYPELTRLYRDGIFYRVRDELNVVIPEGLYWYKHIEHMLLRLTKQQINKVDNHILR